jgi:hypothetical protein
MTRDEQALGITVGARTALGLLIVLLAARRYINLGPDNHPLVSFVAGIAALVILFRFWRRVQMIHSDVENYGNKLAHDRTLAQIELLSLLSLSFVFWLIRRGPWLASLWVLISAGLHRRRTWARYLFLFGALTYLVNIVLDWRSRLGRPGVDLIRISLPTTFLLWGIHLLVKGRTVQMFGMKPPECHQ